ncbi:hypothetical protein FACS1894216_13420 [Synergistales bacterium]|nr:hypothetical protein FACS1894216_13420 [Synergistales bacterium]
MKRKYNISLVFFPQSDGGYCVSCPEIPGCFSDGDTVDEAERNIRELIPEFLADEIKNEINEEFFREGHCLPGKLFREIEYEV